MILHDEMIAEGIRILVKRWPIALCAYVGVPEDHPWAGKRYQDVDLDVHGGLTFSAWGKDTGGEWPDGWYWWGWDYAHAGDHLSILPFGHPWTLAEVIEKAREGAQRFIEHVREVDTWVG